MPKSQSEKSKVENSFVTFDEELYTIRDEKPSPPKWEEVYIYKKGKERDTRELRNIWPSVSKCRELTVGLVFLFFWIVFYRLIFPKRS